MNTCVPIKTNKGTGEGADRHVCVCGGGAAHRLWGGFGLRGFDMKVRHHSLQTLFVLR